MLCGAQCAAHARGKDVTRYGNFKEQLHKSRLGQTSCNKSDASLLLDSFEILAQGSNAGGRTTGEAFISCAPCSDFEGVHQGAPEGGQPNGCLSVVRTPPVVITLPFSLCCPRGTGFDLLKWSAKRIR